jgi:hypothetical protein
LCREKRLDQERELIVRQQRLLQDELETRTKEIMNIRREKTSKVLELQADLSEKIEEVFNFLLLILVLSFIIYSFKKKF